MKISKTLIASVVGGLSLLASYTWTHATDTNPMEKAETVRYIWFASDGEYTEARSGNALPQTQWQNTEKFAVPAETNLVKLWLVAQDVRGGVDWQSYELQLTN